MLTFVDADLGVLDAVVSKDNQDSVTTLLSLDEDHISTEELKLLHSGGREGKNRVVVVGGIVDYQFVGSCLFTQDGGGGVMFRVNAWRSNRSVLAKTWEQKATHTHLLVFYFRMCDETDQVVLAVVVCVAGVMTFLN